MAIRVKCKCGKILNAPDTFAGKKAKCPACKQIIGIPSPKTPVVQPSQGQLKPAPPAGKRCPKCGTDYPSDTVICTTCGINLDTGQPLGAAISSKKAFPVKMVMGIGGVVACIAVLVVAAWFFLGKSGTDQRIPGGSTPEDTFKAVKQAASDEDWVSLFGMSDESLQQEIVMTNADAVMQYMGKHPDMVVRKESRDGNTTSISIKLKTEELFDMSREKYDKLPEQEQFFLTFKIEEVNDTMADKFGILAKATLVSSNTEKGEATIIFTVGDAKYRTVMIEKDGTWLMGSYEQDVPTMKPFLVLEGREENVWKRVPGQESVEKKIDPAMTEKLFKAMKDSDLEAMKDAIEKGADINARTKTGFSVAYAGAHYNPHKKTPAEISKMRENAKKKIMLLIESGVNVNTREKYGWDLLRWASSEGYKDIVEILLEKGADIDAQDHQGFSALRGALFSQRDEVIKFLVEKGADVYLKDNKGKTAVDFAKMIRRNDLAEFMQRSTGSGARTTAEGKVSHSPAKAERWADVNIDNVPVGPFLDEVKDKVDISRNAVYEGLGMSAKNLADPFYFSREPGKKIPTHNFRQFTTDWDMGRVMDWCWNEAFVGPLSAGGKFKNGPFGNFKEDFFGKKGKAMNFGVNDSRNFVVVTAMQPAADAGTTVYIFHYCKEDKSRQDRPVQEQTGTWFDITADTISIPDFLTEVENKVDIPQNTEFKKLNRGYQGIADPFKMAREHTAITMPEYTFRQFTSTKAPTEVVQYYHELVYEQKERANFRQTAGMAEGSRAARLHAGSAGDFGQNHIVISTFRAEETEKTTVYILHYGKLNEQKIRPAALQGKR